MLYGVRLLSAFAGVLALSLTPAGACPRCCCVQAAADKPADKDKPADAKEAEATIKANLAKLSDEDRKLAEAQKWCAIENDDRLGSMGVPVKVMIKDQPVFLCCKGCVDKAKADPDKTLSTVKDLKAKAAKPADK
jgi:hypothetical protein